MAGESEGQGASALVALNLLHTTSTTASPWGQPHKAPFLCQTCTSVLMAQTTLASCLLEQDSPQQGVTESMALREGVGTGADPHPGVHQVGITFLPRC